MLLIQWRYIYCLSHSYVENLPRASETVKGTSFDTGFGGKGANQCVAAAKLGSKTALVAKVSVEHVL